MRKVWCGVVGHAQVTLSLPVSIQSMPQVRRMAKKVCTRCGDTQYTIEKEES